MKEELKEVRPQVILPIDEGQEVEALVSTSTETTLTEQQEEPGDIAAIISNETLVGLYEEILNDLRKKDEEYSGYLAAFVNMVINEGDSTSSSKEALVGLVNTLAGIPDKKAKIADLMTRLKMRERDTMPQWMKAKQTKTTVHIGESGVKREILKQIELQQKRANNGK